MLIANGENRLLEGPSFDSGKEVGKFLSGGQWNALIVDILGSASPLPASSTRNWRDISKIAKCPAFSRNFASR
jgi:hypothetical protein